MGIRRNVPDVWRGGRQDPFRALSTLQREVDQLFDQLMRPGWMPGMSMPPACDMDETDTHYLLSFDLPGMSKDDVKIEISENTLTISGERKLERQPGGEQAPYRFERYHGAFQRSVMLPGGVRPEQVEAQFDSGVLRIAIPKAEPSKARLIPIQEAKEGFFSKLLGRKETAVSGAGAETGVAKERRKGKVA